MKKNLLIHFTVPVLLLVFGGVLESSAQIAFASNHQIPKEKEHQETSNSIISLLKKLEIIHQVNFVYQKELIEGKTFPISINENDKVETILKKVLAPINLKFKKLKGQNSYTILPMKGEKTTSVQVEFIEILKASSVEIPLTADLANRKTLENLRPNLQIIAQPVVTDISVKGKVIDNETNEGLPGVNIQIKGTKKGVNSSSTGEYTINVADKSAVLVFSFIGYETKEVIVGNRLILNISLKPADKTLEEVVVVGLVRRKKLMLRVQFQPLIPKNSFSRRLPISVIL